MPNFATRYTSFNPTPFTLKEKLEDERRQSAKLHEMNRKLQESDDSLWKFKFTSDNSAEAHFLLDQDARLPYANGNACRLFGYSKAELLAMGMPDMADLGAY